MFPGLIPAQSPAVTDAWCYALARVMGRLQGAGPRPTASRLGAQLAQEGPAGMGCICGQFNTLRKECPQIGGRPLVST